MTDPHGDDGRENGGRGNDGERTAEGPSDVRRRRAGGPGVEGTPPGADADGTDDPNPAHPPIACRVVVQRYDDRPDVCTIYDEGGITPLRTTWLSAAEGSFVDPRENR